MRRFLLTTVLLIFGLAASRAQQGVREVPPLYQGPVTQVRGVFVTPIAGVPFSAQVLIESKQALPDGTIETRHTQTLIARDSRGRIRNEMHVMLPEGVNIAPQLLGAHIYDPQTHVSDMMNPMTMVDRRQVVASVGMGNPSPPGAEDLGYTTLNGMQARGTRVTRTIPAQASGTGKEVKVTDEYWYSEELHMNLLERHTDVRGDLQTVAILSIKLGEPPATLFEVPAGYKVADLTPAENSPVGKMTAAH